MDGPDPETLRRIIALATGSAAPARNRVPRAILVAGPPGSGKSRLAEEALLACRRTGGAPIHVDADVLRAYHPDYAALARTDPARAFVVSQPSASRWADGLRDAAIQRRLDLVIEGIFKTEATTAALLDRLRNAGYDIRLVVKIIPAVISLLQIERRYERQIAGDHRREAAPRRVDASAHNIGYRAVEPLLALFDASGLAPCVSLRDLDNTPIPLPNVAGASWSSAVAALRAQPPTDRTQAFCWAALAEVQELRLARGAPDEPEPGSALAAAITFMAAW